ncbi:hypothetical protein M3N64_00585 [Sporolactobacillus sp. CPB3-1]|uniref:Uncharacterized protein n=1 Tax=Sporolactobacillus mangiferae TaxID=2940498 RepID=A0ABT0M6F8_9BACL|nr:hypothetical protein [Sporolactobacillus mangiferae]MCL1630449.1 hypothetical protein [Sporolactobacillus mangiferae]
MDRFRIHSGMIFNWGLFSEEDVTQFLHRDRFEKAHETVLDYQCTNFYQIAFYR